MHRHYSFAIATFKTFPTCRTCKISTFPIKLSQQKSYIFEKHLTNFQKPPFIWKIRNLAFMCWKFEMHRHFSFAIATLQVFQHPEHVKFQLFPLHCPSRSAYIFKSISGIFKNFFLSERKGTSSILFENLKSAQTF